MPHSLEELINNICEISTISGEGLHRVNTVPKYGVHSARRTTFAAFAVPLVSLY
jgi:hypothetical protein